LWCTYYLWRMIIEQYRGKKNSMSIFYVALSTCSVVLPICHVVLSTWSVILLICPVILSTCYVILSHYGMAPIDLRCLQKRKSHDYLRTHKGCRCMLVLWFKTEVLAYCFHDTKVIFLTWANKWIEAFTLLSVLLGNAVAQLDNYFAFITYFND